VPINTVWARIHTARKKLKDRLDATVDRHRGKTAGNDKEGDTP
jgi:DNA-directed RNA polymerase specialized sigma24 family protein